MENMELGMDSTIKYTQAGLTAQVENCCIPWNWEHYHYYYPFITSSPPHNNTEIAFKIVAKLLEKGIIKQLTVKDFIILVKDVSDIV